MSNETEEKQVSTGEKIVTVRIKKNGDKVKKFVYPGKSIRIAMHSWEIDRLRAHLKENNRVVFFDGSNEEEICDFFNVLTPEGKLRPCCRILGEFADNLYSGSDAPKVALKHRGKLVGQETLAKLNRETREYRNRASASARRQRAVPHRFIKAECPQCGNIFEVELGGLTND